MGKVWKGVLWTALVLLCLGLVLAGAGRLTGASLPRIAELSFGGTAEAEEAARAALSAGTETLRTLVQRLPF